MLSAGPSQNRRAEPSNLFRVVMPFQALPGPPVIAPRHTLRIEGVIEELYDVAILPGVRRPMAIGFRSDEIRRVSSIGDH